VRNYRHPDPGEFTGLSRLIHNEIDAVVMATGAKKLSCEVMRGVVWLELTDVSELFTAPIRQIIVLHGAASQKAVV
jgi:hypothetical protein